MKNYITDRTMAAYVGFAIGDALGATTEFMLPREIKTEYGVHNKIIGGGWLKLKPGRVTDDTEMCLALGSSLLEQGGFNVKSVADSFVTWMRSKPVDIGDTVRRGIRGYMTKGQLVSPESEFSAGNGACMRNLPLVIYCLKDWSMFEEMTKQQCHITHNNKLSDMATLNICEALHELVLSGDKLKALDVVSAFIRANPKFSYSRYKGESSGYIRDTYKTVMHYFFDGNSFEDVLVRVVNQGGDADTNGALAGMLAGACYGMESIPAKWLNKLDPNVLSLIKIQVPALLNTPVCFK
jgi:ADP-ribosyl-[dinitrogen reductase] hydrolase